MRLAAVLWLILVSAGAAVASCPPDCVGGGGPPATDCFIEWGGITGTTHTCLDGDASCDIDGKSDGTCTLTLQACINVTGAPGCTAGALSGPPTVSPTKTPAAQALASALAGLDPTQPDQCTPPGIPIASKVSLKGIKPGVSRFAVTAVSSGKRDRDRLKLTCQPGAPPSFSHDLQPIFTAKCTDAQCHVGFSPSGGQNLEVGKACDNSVNARATGNPKLVRVFPGNLKKSYMARKLLGQGLSRFDDTMPQGCPTTVPCLTDAEKYILLWWIQSGARCDN